MDLTLSTAREDFYKARRQAALQDVSARLQGRRASLLSYEEVYQKLGRGGRSERGIQEIPVEAVVGSVGRYADFTRTFLPRRVSDERRWAAMMAIAVERGLDSLPPIEVYKIGDVYFVQDGNHRVSVARQLGLSTIRARVVEIDTRVPIGPDVEAADLIVKAEYEDFLQRTRLDEMRPGADLSMTAPGGYTRLMRQIEACRVCLDAPASHEEAWRSVVAHWYDSVYMPVVEAIRERDLLDEFPGRTETDLYLWVDEHRNELQEALGLEIDPDTAAVDFVAGHSPNRERALERTLDALLPEDLAPGPRTGRWREEKTTDRYAGRLFRRLLVPLSGQDPSWKAFDQAVAVARLEEASLLGLHVVGSEAEREGGHAEAVAAEYERRCREAGVPGRFVVEVGEDGPGRKIAERALLADLVVVRLLHAPQPLRLRSGFRALLQRSARPVLAVPEKPRPELRRGLLAFDGSARAREAMFVATYLAEEHGAALTVLDVDDSEQAAQRTLDEAREYLELHQVQADYLRRTGPVNEGIAATAEALEPDLLLMGGYGLNPVLEIVVGSAVDYMLRQGRWPVLVCR